MKKTIGIIIVFILLAVSFTGCKEEKVNYSIQEKADSTVTSDGSSNVSDFDGLRWRETIDSTDENGKEISIDVDVTTSLSYGNNNNMSVMTCKAMTWDSKSKQNIIKVLFGDADVYLYDEEYIPQSVLESEITALEKDGDNEEKKTAEKYRELLKIAPSDYIEASDYSSNTYIAELNGNKYILEFPQNEEDSLVFYRLEENRMYSKFFYNEYKICNITKEEARNKLEETLTKIGLESIEYYNIMGFGDYTWYFDSFGYSFDTPVVYSFDFSQGGNFEYIDITELSNAEVTDDGVQYLKIKSPVQVISYTDDVKLLSFENITKSIKNEIQENKSKYGTSKFYSWNAILEYYTLTDPENDEKCIIPVWDLGMDMYINAVDGSIIRKKD